MLQMSATVLEANLQTSLKLISFLRFLRFFAVFNAISLNIDELKALNTQQKFENFKREMCWND